jgi:SanA protein
MLAEALRLGVPAEAIVLDEAGLRTYDTCYRASQVYQLESVTLVTQEFHLPRALYLCRTFGLDAQGVAADRRDYPRSSMAYWQVRESFATLLALWEVHVSQPNPAVGEPQPFLCETWKENCN